jgi:hypothetical protein
MNNHHTNPGTVNPADQAFPPAEISNPTPAPGPRAAGSASNGEIQSPAIGPSHAAPVAGLGLTVEVHAGNASQVRTVEASVAETIPPAHDVDGGRQRPGGLPANVCIR